MVGDGATVNQAAGAGADLNAVLGRKAAAEGAGAGDGAVGDGGGEPSAGEDEAVLLVVVNFTVGDADRIRPAGVVEGVEADAMLGAGERGFADAGDGAVGDGTVGVPVSDALEAIVSVAATGAVDAEVADGDVETIVNTDDREVVQAGVERVGE